MMHSLVLRRTLLLSLIHHALVVAVSGAVKQDGLLLVCVLDH